MTPCAFEQVGLIAVEESHEWIVETRRAFEGVLGRNSGPVENQVIDELVGGHGDRRQLIQRVSACSASRAAARSGLRSLPWVKVRSRQRGRSLRLQPSSSGSGINGQPYGPIEPWTL